MEGGGGEGGLKETERLEKKAGKGEEMKEQWFSLSFSYFCDDGGQFSNVTYKK